MTSEPAAGQAPFKDYCLILQVHPEADAGMVEAAYWHLAKRYNEQKHEDPMAVAKLDDLNEAYSVLGNPKRREEYVQVRNAILGIGTLPTLPPREREAPPLTVLEKQRPREREPLYVAESQPPPLYQKLAHFVEPSWQTTLVMLTCLALATAMYAASLSLAFVVPLSILGILVGGVPLIIKASHSPLVESLLHEPEPTEQPDRQHRR